MIMNCRDLNQIQVAEVGDPVPKWGLGPSTSHAWKRLYFCSVLKPGGP